MDALADTTFLVGLWRRQTWAARYPEDHPGLRLGISWVVLGEFWHGAIRAGHPGGLVDRFLCIGIPLMETEDVVPVYAKMCAEIQDSPGYRSIGQNDLWIAATALHYQLPLLSRNRRHFHLIPGLRCEALFES